MKRHLLLVLAFIDIAISLPAATITFNKIYKGTGTTYTINSSSISYTTPIVGSSFKFTSANPADVTFSGNNVAGQLTYTSGGQSYAINGVISRKVGNSNNYTAFYFAETTVLGGNTATGTAYLLTIPTSTYTDNGTEQTNSAPVSSSLNDFLTAQSANSAPVITSNGGGASANISIAENLTAVTTVTSTDANAGDTKVYSITGGADAAKFTINSSTGVLTFISAPNYESPTDAGLDNVYDLQVTVTDSQGATDVQAIAVTVTNTNDVVPVITSNGGGATATVNMTAGATAVTTVTATDGDLGDVLTYSIVAGGNGALFNIDPSSGALTFKTAAVAGTYTVTVKVADAVGDNDTQVLTVVVSSTDTTPPSLVITSSDSNLAAGEAATISFKFSELVQNFTFSDVAVTGGTLGAITQSGTDPTLYTATFTQSGSGAAPTFNVAANTYQDLANNNGTAASLTLAYDVVAPTVVVDINGTAMAYGETELVTFTFSEAPGSTFSIGDITVTNGLLTNLIQTADPKVWTASLKATSSVTGPTVAVITHSYADAAGNLGSSGTDTSTLVPPSIDLANTPASDTGISSSDNITSNRKPVIVGIFQSDPVVTVTVISGANTYVYNNVTVTGGTFSLDLSTATPSSGGPFPALGLAEGYQTISVVGNTSTTETASSTFLVDITVPAVPTVNSQTTTDATPTITGTATVNDGDVLTVLVNGVTYTNGDGRLSFSAGTWTLAIPVANSLSAATYSVTAKVTDPAGNSATDITSNELIVSSSTISIDLANNSTDDTGTSSTDNITSNRKPIISGIAPLTDGSATVNVVSNGYTYTYNNVTINSGAWSLNLATASPSSVLPGGNFPSAGLSDGTVNINITGNTSGAYSANTFVVDITAPATPTVTSQSTFDTTPTITGTATVSAGDVLRVTINGVTYTNGDGNLTYSSGTWSLTIPAGNALAINSYTTTATVTDNAGNVASGSGTTTIRQATVTADLANTSGSDTGTSNTDNITYNRKPVINGTASDDAVVTVTLSLSGTTYTYNNVAVSGGIWSLDLSTASTTSGTAFPATGLTTGTWTVGVSGNTTAATGSNSFVEDYTAPATPTVNSQTTWDTTPAITGTATVNAGDVLRVVINGVTYTAGDGNLSFAAGTWTLNIPAGNALAPASYPTTVTVTDTAGNVATGNGTTTISQPTVTGDLANTGSSDTGTSSTDNITSNRKPVITGTASDDGVVTVAITSGGTTYTYNNVTVSAGVWSLDLSTATTTSGSAFPALGLATGTATIDVTGNSTSATGSNTFTVDYTAPTAPTVNSLTTTDTTPTITGTATVTAGDVFTVNVHGVTYTNGDGHLSYSSGTWTLTIPTGNELPVATYTVLATVTDLAGNSVTNSSTNQLVIYEAVGEVQTFNIIPTPTFTTATINWSNGSRAKRVVFVNETSGTISNPVNGTTYTASANWNNKGTQLGTGYYCVYNGSGSSVYLTHLYPGRLYTIQAFEYNGNAGSESYLTTVGANNPVTVTPWPTTTFYNSPGVSSQEAWNVSSRWDHDTIPTAALHVAVQVYIDGNCLVTNYAESNNLTIKAAHGGVTPVLTIAPDKSLNVIGPFTNSGTGTSLVIKASPALANGTLTFGSGNPVGSVEMYARGYIDTKYHWQYFGIPVQSTTVGTTFKSIGSLSQRVRKYDESNVDPGKLDVGLWKPSGTGNSMTSGQSLVPVDGYEVVQPSATTYTFVGNLFTDNISRTLSYTSGADWAGCNILSNPYTAAIDVTKISFGAGTNASIYLYNTGSRDEWTVGSATAGTYTASSKFTAGQNGVPGQIPSMQGFLINTLNNNNTNATFGYTYSTLSKNTDMQRARAVTNTISTRVDVIGTNSSDKVWIFTDPSCTHNFDNGWDGRKMLVSGLTQIYAVESDGEYQIDAVNDINNVSLGFKPIAVGDYKLVFEHQNVLSAYSKIYLVDLQKNTTTDVTVSGTEYSFTAAATDMTQRFKIITETTGVPSVNSLIKVYNFGSTLFIQNSTSKKADFVLYDATGKMIRQMSVNSNASTTMSTSAIRSGVYVAKIMTESEELTQRLIIK